MVTNQMLFLNCLVIRDVRNSGKYTEVEGQQGFKDTYKTYHSQEQSILVLEHMTYCFHCSIDDSDGYSGDSGGGDSGGGDSSGDSGGKMVKQIF